MKEEWIDKKGEEFVDIIVDIIQTCYPRDDVREGKDRIRKFVRFMVEECIEEFKSKGHTIKGNGEEWIRIK